MLITFRPATPTIVVVELMIWLGGVWVFASPARFVEAAEASDAAVLSMLSIFAPDNVPPTMVVPLIESLLPLCM